MSCAGGSHLVYEFYQMVVVGLVNSRRAPPGHLSGIFHLLGPGGGEFVRKPLPGDGAFVNSSRSS